MPVPITVIVILALLAPPLLAAFVARPARTILPLYAMSLPVASVITLRVPFPQPFNTLSTALGGMAITAIVVHILISRRGRVPTIPVGLWMLFMGWLLLTILWASNPEDAVNRATIALPLVVLMIAVGILPVDRSDVELNRLAIIASGVAVGAYALLLLFTSRALPAHGAAMTERFSIASAPGEADPNILAASLLLPLALSAERMLVGGSIWLSPRTWRRIGLLGLLLTGIAIVLTGSRGGTIAGGLAFALTMILCYRVPEGRERVRSTIRGLAVGAFVIVLAGILFRGLFPGGISQLPAVRDRVRLVQDVAHRLVDTANRGSNRLDIWTGGFAACRLHCGTGAGIGNFEQTYSDLFAFSGAEVNVGLDRPAHSSYLEIAVEAGVVGLTLLLLALLAEWFALSRRPVFLTSPALGAALASVVFAEVFLSALWFKFFWLALVFVRLTENAVEPIEDAVPHDVLATADRQW
jgi:O-antigen ligase